MSVEMGRGHSLLRLENQRCRPWRAVTRALAGSIILGLAAIGAGCGFQITKPLTLKAPTGAPAPTSLRIRELTVAAPTAGAKVFVFEDLTVGTSVAIMGVGAYVTTMSVVSVPAGLKRADFTYSLVNDSGPMVGAALRTLFREDPGATVEARVAADFKYGLAERKKANFGFGDANTIGLNMFVRLVLTSNGQVVLDKNYTAAESDSYSTAWVTYPSSDFLDGLFHKALRNISTQIASDPEVAKRL
jgi:hypothetical protein